MIECTSQYSKKKLLTIILVYILLIYGCNNVRQSVTPVIQEPGFQSVDATSTPAIPTKETEVHTDLISLNSLNVGEYLVIRGIDSHNGENALYVITSEGLYIGKLAEGHGFADATVSSNHEWLAYVDGFNQASTLHVGRIDGGDDFTLAAGCTDPSWSPDSQYLTAACGKIVAFALQDGKWKQAGVIPLPDEFVSLPTDVQKSVQLASPTWSEDGKSIAYTAIFLAMPPQNSVLGPYISPVSCLFDETTCNTYALDTGEIHPRPIFQWLQVSNRIAIYSFTNDSELYLVDVATKKLVETIALTNKGLIDSYVFSPSEEFLAVKPSTTSAFIMDLRNKKVFELSRFQSEGTQVLFWIKINR